MLCFNHRVIMYYDTNNTVYDIEDFFHELYFLFNYFVCLFAFKS